MIEGLLNQVNKRVTVIKDLPAELPKAECDALLLRQVVQDVVENAVEAMTDKPDPRLTVRAYYDSSAKQVQVEFTDNGPGIPEKLQNSLFVPAGTTKEGRLGIGLWFCRTFMQAIGGDMLLKDTAPGRGSTFAIKIPCVIQEGAQLPTDSPGRPLKDILIVDDAPRFRDLLRNALANEGYAIETAASLAAAREALAAAQFKLAILDIRLVDEDKSNLDGLQLFHDIGRTNRRTKVILITGWEEAEKHLPAESNPSIVGFIKKDAIDLDRYRSLVRKAVTGAGQ
jgi:CheY-like chemotaxis protein